MSGRSMDRRDFMKAAGMTTAAGLFSSILRSTWAGPGTDDTFTEIRRPLQVKPVLVDYQYTRRMDGRSWRAWGGLHDDEDYDREAKRIRKELKQLSSRADFPVNFQSLARVHTQDQAKKIRETDCDLMLLYAASGHRGLYDTLCDTDTPALWYVRHKSGPTYLWYEIYHPRFLRRGHDDWQRDDASVHDVVVDDYSDLMWRLRAWCGLVNTQESCIVALGGAGGWGMGSKYGPMNGRKIWGLDIKEVPHEAVTKQMKAIQDDEKAMKKRVDEARAYINADGVEAVETDWKFIKTSFVLRDALLNVMKENDADAVTILGCMGYGRKVGTAPCLAFGLINDAGPMAFCESDFAVVPSGVLLRYITGKPVFLHNPTLPHDGEMTGAHCTAPRRMNGKDLEPVKIQTHYESDWGAAPKVQFSEGQEMTSIAPYFSSEKWLGVRSKVLAHPEFDICRSQVEMGIEGDCEELLEDMRGFHWMSCYGDYLREVGYLAERKGIEWENMSEDD